MKLAACLPALVALVLAAAAGAATDDAQKRAVDALFRDFDRPDSPGFAVGISRGGEVLYAKGYGTADLERGTPITPGTSFEVASVSKQFAALSVALLARDGKLDLDTDLGTYLPYVPDLGYRITVRHLVYHTSGLRDYVRALSMAGERNPTQEQVVRFVTRQRGLNFEPGTAFWYCNTGYVLLPEIVRAITGRSLRQFTSERIFEPLAMNGTFFYDDPGELVPGRAEPYDRGDGETWKRQPFHRQTIGSGGLVTTVEDFLKWIRNFGHPVVGDRKLIAAISEAATLDDGSPIDIYGFGLERSRLAGHEAIHHGGSSLGYKAHFAWFPKSDFGVVVLTNTGIANEGYLEAIADIYLNGGPGSALAQRPAAVTPDPGLVGALVGRYVFSYEKVVTLYQTDAGLMWKTSGEDPKPVVFREDGSFGFEQQWGPRYAEYFRPPVNFANSRIEAFEEVSPGWDGRTAIYRRVEPISAATADLQELAGDYYSTELDTTYTLSIERGRLTGRSFRLDGKMTFDPVLTDRFDAEGGPVGTIIVERDARGRATGLAVYGFRVSHVRFQKRSLDPNAIR